MATPPNLQPQRPRNESRTVPNQDSLESEGDEDREAILSLQTKLHAISPLPETESRVSVEFDFSALALPVPLEFADTDSLQDVSVDVFDEDIIIQSEMKDNLPNIEPDEEPAEVEVKPILEAQANISVVVEPPSSEEQDSSETRTDPENQDLQLAESPTPGIGERIVEGAEEPALERKNSGSKAASRRISSGSMLHALRPTASASTAVGAAAAVATGVTVRPPSPEVKDDKETTEREGTTTKKRKMPIINPLVSLPMWPNVESGGLISKVLLANADALCAAVSPLMDLEEDPLELFEEKCVMNSYFGIGIDAKITLDFHMKREEHPEKCRSRARNYMWYGVLGSKEWLQKTYKNLEQRVLLECDGTRIPLPTLQGIVVLNIPSFMGGTNFWGGSKEDDCFIAPSFDDRVLEVVAVFGSVQMAASRIINLQHHRIAQCHSVKITILGEEGVPIQVDGEAWIQPPGIIRIVHKNRMQMLCRNRALERSLEAWQEKQRYQSCQKLSHGPPLTEEENQLLIGFLEATTALVRYVRLLAISQPGLDQDLYSLATQASSMLDKMHPGGKIIEGPSLRSHLTDLVNIVRQLHQETDQFLKEKAALYNLRPNQKEKLASSLSHVVSELRKCTDINGLVHFITSEEGTEKKPPRSNKSSGLFRLKFRRPDPSRSRSSQSHRSCGMSEGCSSSSQTGLNLLTVQHWSNDEVAAWLESLQLGEYREDFIRHDIRGPELLTLERRDLKELGIHKVGHIKRIQQAIWEIKEAAHAQS